MNDLNVIDYFLTEFIRYIDSGFGLLNGEVTYLAGTLIVIDIVLAAAFWAIDSHNEVIVRFLKKVLYIGAFAFVISNFALLADLIFRSFTGLGLAATSTGLTAEDLMRPGRLAGIGYEAAYPLLEHAGAMIGFTTFFDNFVKVLVLLFAWAVVILAFFILAVQLFIAILEFKLTTLAGFVLVPFAFWNKTSFLAERVLGMVVTSGIKVMVLAVIVGISSGFFAAFTTAMGGQEPTLGQTMSLVLAAISLFGLGIFAPGIAAGLVTGAPQLGAGAAVGAVGGVAAATVISGAAAVGATRMIAGAGSRALSAATSLRSMATAPAGAAGSAAGAAAGQAGSSMSSATTPPDPLRAVNRMRNESRMRTSGHIVAQSVKDGDRGGSGANPSLSEEK